MIFPQTKRCISVERFACSKLDHFLGDNNQTAQAIGAVSDEDGEHAPQCRILIHMPFNVVDEITLELSCNKPDQNKVPLC